MKAAYTALHRQGWAHSVEIWSGEELAGGLYGLSIGRIFFGESMFSRTSNASKAAMFALCRTLADAGFELFDCQVESPHLTSLGAHLMSRGEYLELLGRECDNTCGPVSWPDSRVDIAVFGLSGN
jgi:leucyl/phenylalanyl-tRNA--protein transferase